MTASDQTEIDHVRELLQTAQANVERLTREQATLAAELRTAQGDAESFRLALEKIDKERFRDRIDRLRDLFSIAEAQVDITKLAPDRLIAFTQARMDFDRTMNGDFASTSVTEAQAEIDRVKAFATGLADAIVTAAEATKFE